MNAGFSADAINIGLMEKQCVERREKKREKEKKLQFGDEIYFSFFYYTHCFCITHLILWSLFKISCRGFCLLLFPGKKVMQEFSSCVQVLSKYEIKKWKICLFKRWEPDIFAQSCRKWWMKFGRSLWTWVVLLPYMFVMYLICGLALNEAKCQSCQSSSEMVQNLEFWLQN